MMNQLFCPANGGLPRAESLKLNVWAAEKSPEKFFLSQTFANELLSLSL